ncbi:membrane protein insertion efficiency factor YidD [Pseudomonas bubulae]|uniref:membrane protein insertion efficiency factor YidD n=1 Tax=Pseudomonas bubulae TaxID=2316085 RepID=UPI00309ADBEF
MISWLSVRSIKLYQHIGPSRLRDACRFKPSCSNYALLAIEKHGALRGWKMALNRIHRCRFPNGGNDYP